MYLKYFLILALFHKKAGFQEFKKSSLFIGEQLLIIVED